jgi:hypothetical protein
MRLEEKWALMSGKQTTGSRKTVSRRFQRAFRTKEEFKAFLAVARQIVDIKTQGNY